jgi:ATP-dependent Zn protease
VAPRGARVAPLWQLPEKDESSVNRRQLQARLDVLMGGRVAEELIYGMDYITTGASSDLSYATQLAQVSERVARRTATHKLRIELLGSARDRNNVP